MFAGQRTSAGLLAVKMTRGMNQADSRMESLSAAAPAKLVGMILAEDVKGLSALKGVGPKTAQRLVVELREGLGDLGLGEQVQLEQAAAARVVPHERDVREALANLGYSTREIDKAMDRAKNVVAPGADAETVLGAILRFIGNN